MCRWSRIAMIMMVCLGAGLGGCDSRGAASTEGHPIELTIFAASSLKPAFDELIKAFEGNHPQVTLTPNYAGSQQLIQQLTQGAQADVLALASEDSMRTAIQGGYVNVSNVAIFGGNLLCVILPKDNPANMNTLADLAKPGVRLVVADESVPVGQYARQFIRNASAETSFGPEYGKAVLANVVSHETSASGIVSKVRLGEADAGVVYVTDAIAAKADVIRIDIPLVINVGSRYLVGIITKTAQLDASREFVTFVLSADGQKIISSQGFIPAHQLR